MTGCNPGWRRELHYIEISRGRRERQDVGDPIRRKPCGSWVVRRCAVIGVQGDVNGPASSCRVSGVIRNQVDTNLLHVSRMLGQETIANHTAVRSEARVSQSVPAQSSAIRLGLCGSDESELAQQQHNETDDKRGYLTSHAHFPRIVF